MEPMETENQSLKPILSNSKSSTHETKRAERLAWIIDQLALIAVARGQSVSPERLRVNAEDLIDIQQEALSVAFGKARREIQYFPTVAEIRKLAGVGDQQGSIDAEARAAWEMLELFVKRYVDCDVHGNYGPQFGWYPKTYPLLSERIMGTVNRTGGWSVYKTLTDESFPFQQKRFFDEYKAFALAEPIAEPGRLLVMPRTEQKELPAPPQQGIAADPRELSKALQDIAKLPEPEHIKKLHRFDTKPLPVIPAVALTPEQIKNRRDRERREIERYKEAQGQ